MELLETIDTFDDLVEKAAEIQDRRNDYIIKNVSSNLWMNDDGSLSYRYTTPSAVMVDSKTPTDWALSQMSGKLGIPSGYLSQCITAGMPDLASENANKWLMRQNGNKKVSETNYLVRTYGDKIDGILSDRYTRFDSDEILSCFASPDDFHLVGSYLSDDRMHVRMIWDKKLDIPGEDLFPAIFLDSSDVGRCSLMVRFGIWKQICSNGMCIAKISGTLFHQRHIGISRSDVAFALRNIDTPALIEASTMVIRNAMKEKIDWSDPSVFDHMLAEIRKNSGLDQNAAKEVMHIAEAKYGTTTWGVVNGMTEIAQRYSLDDRERIENAAGILVAA